METLTGTILPSTRYGWYYRPRTDSYEFWWGYHSQIILEAPLLEIMPDYIVMEIQASATVKPLLED